MGPEQWGVTLIEQSVTSGDPVSFLFLVNPAFPPLSLAQTNSGSSVSPLQPTYSMQAASASMPLVLKLFSSSYAMVLDSACQECLCSFLLMLAENAP